jgi:tRNA (guanine37-N1)-methyltransferase
MITFDVVTIFPRFFDSFLQESIIKRAQKQKLIKIRVFDLRDFTQDKHQTVDDKPYGGGRGMVIQIEPVFRALHALKIPIAKSKFQKKSQIQNPKIPNTSYKLLATKSILFSPRGKKFNQQTAYRLSKLGRVVMVCGRYEGVDERVNKLVDEIISLGDFVMMGGEVAALALIEAVSRLVPGVLGHSELLGERIGKDKSFTEYPQYTRPEIFTPGRGVKWPVPKVLLTGHHRKIQQWRQKHQRTIL